MPDLQRLSDKYAGVNFGDLSPVQLEEFLGAVARRGAFEALAAAGLNDETAGADVRDLRNMLRGFRMFKKTAGAVRKSVIIQTIKALGAVLRWALTIFLIWLITRSDPTGIMKSMKISMGMGE